MSKTQEIWYEPHPVTPERKAELRAKGLTILDERFKPADASEEADGDAPAKRGRKPGKPADAE